MLYALSTLDECNNKLMGFDWQCALYRYHIELNSVITHHNIILNLTC